MCDRHHGAAVQPLAAAESRAARTDAAAAAAGRWRRSRPDAGAQLVLWLQHQFAQQQVEHRFTVIGIRGEV